MIVEPNRTTVSHSAAEEKTMIYIKMKNLKLLQRRDLYDPCVTRVTQTFRKNAGQTQKRGLNALFSMASVSHFTSGTSLERCGTSRDTTADPLHFGVQKLN
jgi:hypothetical protein